MARIGDTVKVNSSIATHSNERHEFFAGLTFRHIDSNKDFDLPLQSKITQGDAFFQPSFLWEIPSNAPMGAYSIIHAVWENAVSGVPSGRLVDRVIPNAFSVQ